jgi:hypothetical protein
LTAYSHVFKKEIPELAHYYIQKKYKLPTDGTMGIKTLLNLVLAVRPTTDLVSNLYKRFETDCSPAVCREYKSLLDLVIKQVSTEVRVSALDYVDLPEEVKDTMREHLKRKQDEEIHQQKTKKTHSSTEVAVAPNSKTEEADLPPLQYYNNTVLPRDHHKTEDLCQYRMQYKNSKSTATRVEVLLEIETYLVNKYPEGKQKNLVEPARNFYQRNVKPVVSCLHGCHNGIPVDLVQATVTAYGKKLFRGNLYECTKCTLTNTANNTVPTNDATGTIATGNN